MSGHSDQYYENLIKDDLRQVKENAKVINIVNAIEQKFEGFLGGGGRFFGRTSFEGHRLNDMIDMVEPTNPEQVEEVGTSLMKAGEAITKAAELLDKDILAVDWEGESGEAFRIWSTNLVKKAEALADYSKVVGKQITLAGSGLASVRKSMPPRDLREEPKTVAQIPAVKRVDSNEEYVAAVKAEKHRQEAINQMIRLSSFYAVSEETLAAQEPPTFDPMPKVGVPEPSPFHGAGDPPVRGQAGFGGDTSVVGTRTSGAEALMAAGRVDGTAAGSAPQIHPDTDASMQIDSVAPVVPQETTRPVTVAPTPAPSTGPVVTGPPVPPLVGGVKPVTTAGGRVVSGTGGVNTRQTPVSAQGQVPRSVMGGGGTAAGQGAGRNLMHPVGPTGQQPAATGRAGGGARGTMGPVGPTGQHGTTGRTGGVNGRGPTGPLGPVGQQAASGRAAGSGRGPMGPVGQTQPVAGRQTGGRGPAPVAGGMPASQGVVGGITSGAASQSNQAVRPVRSGVTANGGVVGGRPATPSGPNGAGVPRGTVIGGDAGPARGAGEQPGRRGVVGVPSTPAAGASGARTGQGTGRPQAAPGGVTGTPRETNSRRTRRSSGGDRREAPPAAD
ncbi:hypothetical protein [Streptomyces sp. MJP52]|uniref:hypothetical protein n=1 Tax=Streptomyces sp. MJP52 TaxID=2940555 RepID=UPI002474718A|nr:hypothetical protein [Streptomyces sp. MJP52]MDH6224650.1 uncharacterized protein YukE [Streptomyces sp. MJP52]